MTPRQKHTIEHDVIDGDAWDAHQRAHFIAKHGEKEGTRIADENLAAKCKRIEEKTDYMRSKDAPGYENRKARQAKEDAETKEEMERQLAELVEQERQRKVALDAAIDAKVRAILAERR
jgi:hypothetical protein